MTVTWEPYVSPGNGSIVGDLRTARVVSPQLGHDVQLLVWLPPSHPTEERSYGVLYMWDAQNLFDAATSNSGEWEVDETMSRLASEGIEWIVVGLPHGGDERPHEYAPWRQTHGFGGRGDASLAFLLETAKPLVDASFRTRPEREHTALAGSSLGGLMSLYGLFRHPEAFSRVGVLSPAFAFTEGRLSSWLEPLPAPAPDARIWMDVGTLEGSGNGAVDAEYVTGFEEIRDVLGRKGLGSDRLRTLVDAGGIHHESAWARRLPEALRFLLGEATLS